MPIRTIYRSHRSVTRPDGRYSVTWTEYTWEAVPGEYRASDGDYFHRRSDPEAIAVRVPPGELPCCGAEAAYHLAVAGEKGFRLEEPRRPDEAAIFRERAASLLDEHAQIKGPHGLPGWNLKASALLTFEACRRIGLEDAEMARRRREDGPTLFGDPSDESETQRPETGIVEAMEALRGAGGKAWDGVADPAAFLGRDDPSGRYRDACERALAQLRSALEGDEMARCATARAILEGALDG